jgi:hypothetical protein
VARIAHLPRLYLAIAAAAFFLAGLGLSWTEGGDHLWLQGVAMALALIAFGLAFLAADDRRR